ncbi:unnamed protein product [Caenorhabditis auriculariae]|uniref:Uncharacterized protein n=1 Tax=Caenorhabditis auriculariae TaxID=2777116 RepID=A0A8S1H1A8_9PELO|nr:unnamed protein product [Caenorhabditis auriculariae]
MHKFETKNLLSHEGRSKVQVNDVSKEAAEDTFVLRSSKKSSSSWTLRDVAAKFCWILLNTPCQQLEN